MILGQVLNTQATLNNFTIIGSKEFIPGEQFKLVLRLFDTETNLRYIPVNTNEITVNLTNRDGSIVNISNADITIEPDDRSIFSFSVSEEISQELAGGNFTFSLDLLGDGSNIQKGIALNALARIIDGGC